MQRFISTVTKILSWNEMLSSHFHKMSPPGHSIPACIICICIMRVLYLSYIIQSCKFRAELPFLNYLPIQSSSPAQQKGDVNIWYAICHAITTTASPHNCLQRISEVANKGSWSSPMKVLLPMATCRVSLHKSHVSASHGFWLLKSMPLDSARRVESKSVLRLAWFLSRGVSLKILCVFWLQVEPLESHHGIPYGLSNKII